MKGITRIPTDSLDFKPLFNIFDCCGLLDILDLRRRNRKSSTNYESYIRLYLSVILLSWPSLNISQHKLRAIIICSSAGKWRRINAWTTARTRVRIAITTTISPFNPPLIVMFLVFSTNCSTMHSNSTFSCNLRCDYPN